LSPGHSGWSGGGNHACLFKGRASSLTQNAPYGLLRDLFANRFDIHDSDPPQVVRASLENWIGEAFGVLTSLTDMDLKTDNGTAPGPDESAFSRPPGGF
jgi:hypothetical protein